MWGKFKFKYVNLKSKILKVLEENVHIYVIFGWNIFCAWYQDRKLREKVSELAK